MKKLFTILIVLLSTTIYSQPVMDGTFDGESVWGAPKAIANDTAGWDNANAKKFYVTADANYLYLGAEVTASYWMGWAFVINTKPGGATSDSWARRVYYAYPPDSNAHPDFTARGHFNGWAEIYRWIGTGWQRFPDDGLASTEYGENIGGFYADGWVEIRVPQSTLGSPAIGDIQFYVGGDNNEHGCFDACPDDDNAISWTDSSTLSNYKTNIRFAQTLNLTAMIEGIYDGSTMISDTVVVELCNESSPYDKKDEAKVVLNSSGVGTANFYKAAEATNYYLAIKHRNGLQTWSATTPQFSSGSMNYNFTTAASQAYNSNLTLVGSKYCIYSGDVSDGATAGIQDGYIDIFDDFEVYNDSYDASYRLLTDLNLDTFVDIFDDFYCYNNSYNGIYAQYPGFPRPGYLKKDSKKVEGIIE